MTTKLNRRLGQGFIGIGSGLSGRTLIMMPVWSHEGRRASVVRLRLIAGADTEQEVLGRTSWVRSCVYATYVVMPNGTEIRLKDTACVTDAAMGILQYLSDRKDPRVHLEFFETELDRGK